MEKVICNSCGAESPGNSKYCSRCGYELPKAIAEVKNEPIQQKSKPKRKLTVPQVIGLTIGFAVAGLVQHFFFGPPSYNKILMQAASEINKNCPINIDNETRLDNCTTIPDNIFIYNYTLMHMDKASIDTIAMKKLNEPRIINAVKTTPGMKTIRDMKSTVNYCYRDKNGLYVLTISVPPEKYE